MVDRRGTDAGFTVLGLMVVIAVMNIGLAVAMTSWMTIDKRAKETELIWRGQQYARALACHRQQTGALPDTLDEMLESDCLRALFPEPMSADGQWNVIHETDLQRENAAGGGNRSATDVLDGIDRELRGPSAFLSESGGGNRGGAGSAGSGGGGRGLGLGGGLGVSTNETVKLQASFERLRQMSQRISRNFNVSSGNGIVGVASRSTAEALRLYNGETTYDAWRFMAAQSGGGFGAPDAATPGPGVGFPGGPGGPPGGRDR